MSLDNGSTLRKPSAFPISAPVQPLKLANLSAMGVSEAESSSSFSSEDGSFKTNLLGKLDLLGAAFDNEIQRQAAKPNPGSATNEPNLATNIKALRNIEGIYEGTGLLDQRHLATIDQNQSASNFENIKDDKYTNIKELLLRQQAFLGKEATLGEGFQANKERPGDGYTGVHNFNLYHGMNSHIIKDWDKETATFFDGSTYFGDLHQDFVSPARVLDKKFDSFWSNIHSDIDKLSDPFVIKDVADSFQDIQRKDKDGNITTTYSIKPNFNTIIQSQAWKSMDKKSIFSFVFRAAEAKSRYYNTVRSMFGTTDNFVTPTDTPKVAEDGTITPVDLVAKRTEQKKALTDHITHWWETIGNTLPEAFLFPFGLVAEITPEIQKTFDWGQWSDPAASKKSALLSEFRSDMIGQYSRHFADEFLPEFVGNGKVTETSFTSSIEIGQQEILKRLVRKKIVSSDGSIQPIFTKDTLRLDIGLSLEKEAEISQQLRYAQSGGFNLEKIDQVVGGGSKRQNIRLKSDDGQYRTLTEAVHLTREGGTPREQIQNMETSYNYFMDIFQTLSAQEANSLSVPLHKDATWYEKKDADWSATKGPLQLDFQSKEDLKAFKDNIQSILALLQPAVTFFGVNDTRKVLVDNSLELDDKGLPITEGHPQYQLSIANDLNQKSMDSQLWGDAASFLREKVIGKVSQKMFDRSITNFYFKMQHDQEVTKYKRDKDTEDLEKYQQEVDEAQRAGETRKLEAEIRQRQAAQRQAEEAALRQQELNRQAQQQQSQERS